MHEATPFKVFQLLATNSLSCESSPYKYERLIPKSIDIDMTYSLLTSKTIQAKEPLNATDSSKKKIFLKVTFVNKKRRFFLKKMKNYNFKIF